MFGGGMGWGVWGAIGSAIVGLIGIGSAVITWRRDRDLKTLDQAQKIRDDSATREAKNRDDAVSILRAQLLEQETRHNREMDLIRGRVGSLEKLLEARTSEWT